MKNTSNIAHTLLTVEKIAEILLIKPNTIHNKKWQLRTKCPLHKIGRRLYCVTSEFNTWLESSSRDAVK